MMEILRIKTVVAQILTAISKPYFSFALQSEYDSDQINQLTYLIHMRIHRVIFCEYCAFLLAKRMNKQGKGCINKRSCNNFGTLLTRYPYLYPYLFTSVFNLNTRNNKYPSFHIPYIEPPEKTLNQLDAQLVILITYFFGFYLKITFFLFVGSRSVHFRRPIRQSGGLPAFLSSLQPTSYADFRSRRQLENSYKPKIDIKIRQVFHGAAWGVIPR